MIYGSSMQHLKRGLSFFLPAATNPPRGRERECKSHGKRVLELLRQTECTKFATALFVDKQLLIFSKSLSPHHMCLCLQVLPCSSVRPNDTRHVCLRRNERSWRRSQRTVEVQSGQQQMEPSRSKSGLF